jgi:hypothetical protein
MKKSKPKAPPRPTFSQRCADTRRLLRLHVRAHHERLARRRKK